MAVSHQWFVQWSAPSMLFADITSQYNKVNEHFGNLETKWISSSESSIHRYNNRNVYNGRLQALRDYSKETLERHKPNDRSRSAAITLWLTVMGLSQPQLLPADNETPPFSTLYKWKNVDFEFPSIGHRREALATGKFVPESVLPLGLEVWGSRIWVTLPNWRSGVPATLATVPRAGGVISPALKPYPDWSYHTALNDDFNCTKMISVFRVNTDPCGRLWVLDSGKINAQDNSVQVCPPSIFVFDLLTDMLIARYLIPDNYVLQDSLFANIILDTKTSDCSDLHAYIADTWRFGLIVFRQEDGMFWKYSNPLFYPDPLASNFTLHGLNFQWSDGIFGLALTPVDHFRERMLFFHSLSSYREFYVPTSVLRRPSQVNNSFSEFNLVGESRGLYGQSSASAFDDRGVMFYGLVSRDSIGCWDSNKPYRKRTLGTVAENAETLIFPNDIKINQGEQQNVWVISNKLPMFQNGSLDSDDYNYRILYADTKEAVRGTVCDPAIRIPIRRLLVNRR
ncbi:protein yellow-like [Bombyx mandarina]|uniref:Protein yellow-like n=1 Tax=Bombyx mandarina TaxID=7092 RepID=A0A6J2KNQ4_BOMMA|nr:protein yellow-like [Bombyx mandarina]